MPNSLNRESMPKVRASSGTMGTTRGPKFSSRIRSRIRLVIAMVVETARPSEPLVRLSKVDELGIVKGRRSRIRRLGIEPPSARRR